MKCAVVQMESDLTLSGSRIYDWMLRTYNREKPLEIFGTIGQIAAMRPIDNTPWTIYAKEVSRKFKELKHLLATTEGNLTDWWQLMLWQRGMPPIPAVHVKLRKASSKLVTEQLDLDEWYDKVATILQNNYEVSKVAPGQHHAGQAFESQAFSLGNASTCPCCGSHDPAQMEANREAAMLNIAHMTQEQLDEADVAITKKHSVEFVQ